jgi:lipopolysaccharide biosynthesis glycosyltransferase
MHKNSAQPFRLVLGFDPLFLSAASFDVIQNFMTYLKIEIEFFEVDLASVQKRNIQHISSSSYIRFSIFDRYPDSILWIDADTVCMSGWDSLFQFAPTMSSNQVVVAVQDPVVLEQPTEQGLSNIALSQSGSAYFNGGVIFVDTDKWRALNGPNLWKLAYEKYFDLGFQFEDQCILNYVLIDRVKLIGNTYNYLIGRGNGSNLGIKIFHFAGSVKPWHMRKFIFVLTPFYKFSKYFIVYAHYENSLICKFFFLDFKFFCNLVLLRTQARRKWLITKAIIRKLRF